MFNFPPLGGIPAPYSSQHHEREEQKFIDEVAIIAFKHFLNVVPSSATPEQIAYSSYQMARAMSKERKTK